MTVLMELVESRDPAIDRHAMGADGIQEYAETREASALKLLPGRSPMIVRAREIPHHLMMSFVLPTADANGLPTPESCARAFRCAVVEVENQRTRDGHVPGVHTLPCIPQTEILADEAMKRFEPATILELGGVCYRRGAFPFTTGLRFPLPPLCREALVEAIAATPRPVVANPNSPPSSSDAASSLDSGPTTSTPAMIASTNAA